MRHDGNCSLFRLVLHIVGNVTGFRAATEAVVRATSQSVTERGGCGAHYGESLSSASLRR